MIGLLSLGMVLFGAAVSIVFWIPGLVDRTRLRELLGRRYFLVYVIYAANGPLLVLLGTLIFFHFRG